MIGEKEWEATVENIDFLREEAMMIPMGIFYVMGCNELLHRYKNGERTAELYKEMK